MNRAPRNSLVIAFDTSRQLVPALPEIFAGIRQAMPRVDPEWTVSLCALGDPRCHLLQATAFHSLPTNTEALLNGLHICGLDRSFETALYYYARQEPTPASTRRVLLMCGTGPVRDAVSAAQIRHFFGDPVESNPYTRDLLHELGPACRVGMLYLRRGPYDNTMTDWEMLLGPENVVVADDPGTIGHAIHSLGLRLGGVAR